LVGGLGWVLRTCLWSVIPRYILLCRTNFLPFDVNEVAYGSSAAAPRFRVDCVVFGVGSAVCTASPLLMSVVISGQEASSFRHVLGLSTSGAESQLF
jgi:hypothetical protein